MNQALSEKIFKTAVKESLKLRTPDSAGDETGSVREQSVEQQSPVQATAETQGEKSQETACETPNESLAARAGSQTFTEIPSDESTTADAALTETAANAASAGAPEHLPDRHDLLDILEDPAAPESDWISAASALSKHERKREREQQENDRNAETARKQATQRKQKRTFKFLGATAVILLLVGIAQNASHKATPNSAPNPAPISHEIRTAASNKGDVDFGPYMATLQRQIRSHWHPPKGSETDHVVMHFKISRTGEMSNVGFERLSRISDADAAALKAVIESMPSIGPLPPGSPDSVDIVFTFDYNVFKGSKN